MTRILHASVHLQHHDPEGRLLFEETRTNLITSAQRDFSHTQVYGTSPGGNGLNYIALSADAVTETAASTTLSNEIASNGFTRAQGTVSHSTGTTQTTVQHQFTASGSQRIRKMALFSASSSGTMGHVVALTDVTYASGDKLTVSITLTIAETGATHTGHVLDGSTIFLGRFNEAVAGGYTSVTDSGSNARHLTVESSTFSQIVPGPRAYTGPASGRTSGSLARRMITTASAITNTNTGGDATALQGNWTCKAWIYLDALSLQSILTYGASGESTATNYQLALRVTAAGTLNMFWETGAGATDVNTDASTPGGVSAATWTHVAVVKEDDLINVGKKKLTFYVAGTSKGTVSNLTNSTGGTSCQWQFIGFLGNVRSAMVTSDVSSSGTIAADAANTSGSTAYTHTDSNIIVHYACDDLPDVWDEAGNYHMRFMTGAPPGTAVLTTIDNVDPLVADGGYARWFGGSTEFQASIYLNSTMRSAVLASFTFECWLRGGDNMLAAQIGLMCFGNPGVESSADNYAAIDLKTDGTIQYDIEHSSGTNGTAASPSAVFSSTNKHNRHHFALVKSQSAGSAIFGVYLDGVKIGADSATITEFDGGTNNVLRIGIGNGGTGNRWIGVIDDVRISNVARSGSDILASYQAG